MEQDPF